ncbi:penicillin-binding protein 2 [Candidatus Cyanaurora vandensis]|uniref:peptidoglycan D,D-transpeptidase FtsI family protein n=1 Tax=Candidatus Cyanaurora vandensis TaxID=2714958 RepID=UPI00257C16ED|nr:penicillin-binding protein 2 [Candidatus Cyanaurora vandensis]
MMRSPRPQTKKEVWRYWLVGAALVLAPVGLGVRAWSLSQNPDLRVRAVDQQTRPLDPFIPRLTMVDRRQNILATDQVLYTLYAHPRVFYTEAKKQVEQTQRGEPQPGLIQATFSQQTQVAARLLAPLLKQPAPALLALLRDQKESTVVLSRRVDEATFRRIQSLIIPRTLVEDKLLPSYLAQNFKEKVPKLTIPGLEFQTRRQRIYPLGTDVAPIVGFVDYDGKGRAGIEQYYEKQMVVDRPAQAVSINGFGQLLAAAPPRPLLDEQLHHRLRLTLDARLQNTANRALSKGMTLYKAKRGTAIVMDPQSGAILALAVAPSYDNNNFALYAKNPKVFRPWPVTEIYEPGSTFKPVNIALALDSGKVKANDVVYDPGSMTLSRRTIRNFDGKGRGSLSVTKVLQVSNNIGMVKLMQKMGAADYYDRLRGIGIGKASGVDLPNEAAGVFKDRAQFIRYPIEAATPAFGQGVTMTPLQLLRFHCAIANGGLLVTPHVVEALTDENGRVIRPFTPAPSKRIFSAESARQVRQMLVQVVEGGSGKPAQIPGYWVGGKTGTAQKVLANGRGYVAGQRVTSFVGHFPGDAPRYVVLVVFDEPPGRAFGGTTAAPVVHEILTELVGFEGIKPTRPIAQSQERNDALN